MNLSATISALSVCVRPRLCLPLLTISTFAHLPVPLPFHARAIVVDKDNSIASPHAMQVCPAYMDTWKRLLEHYKGKVVIVSNSAGSNETHMADKLETELGIPVLRHAKKKPACSAEIFEHFSYVCPQDITVIGDRLFTDVVMANKMGARAVWIRDGVNPHASMFSPVERRLVDFLHTCGFTAP